MGPSDEEGDPNPCPEDEEFHKAPDADSMEEAIGKFVEGLEGQERAGFSQIHSLLQCLPVSVQKERGLYLDLSDAVLCRVAWF
jgi:hypothetical protein